MSVLLLVQFCLYSFVSHILYCIKTLTATALLEVMQIWTVSVGPHKDAQDTGEVIGLLVPISLKFSSYLKLTMCIKSLCILRIMAAHKERK
jgi:hypothetical protein